LENVKNVIHNTLNILGLDKGIHKAKAITGWAQVVGKEIAEHAQAVRIRNGTIFVVTSSPAWAQEMSLMKKRLIKQINCYLGSDDVKDIRFSPKGTIRSVKSNGANNKNKASCIELTKEDNQKIKEVVESLCDEELEKRIRKLMVCDIKLKKFKEQKNKRSGSE